MLVTTCKIWFLEVGRKTGGETPSPQPLSLLMQLLNLVTFRNFLRFINFIIFLNLEWAPPLSSGGIFKLQKNSCIAVVIQTTGMGWYACQCGFVTYTMPHSGVGHWGKLFNSTRWVWTICVLWSTFCSVFKTALKIRFRKESMTIVLAR